MNFFTRKIAKKITSSCELIKTGDNEYRFDTHMPFKTHSQSFIPDQEMEQETCDGRKVKNIFSFADGNKLIERQVEPNREVVITREFQDKEIIAFATVNDVKCKMWSELIIE